MILQVRVFSVPLGLVPRQVAVSSLDSSKAPPPPPPPPQWRPLPLLWDHLDLEVLQDSVLVLVWEWGLVVLARLLRWVVSRLWVEGQWSIIQYCLVCFYDLFV